MAKQKRPHFIKLPNRKLGWKARLEKESYLSKLAEKRAEKKAACVAQQPTALVPQPVLYTKPPMVLAGTPVPAVPQVNTQRKTQNFPCASTTSNPGKTGVSKYFRPFPADPGLECSEDGTIRKVGTTVPYGSYIDKHGGQLWIQTRKRKIKRANIIASTWHKEKNKLKLGPGGVKNVGTYHVWHKDGQYSNCSIANLAVATHEEALKLRSTFKDMAGPWNLQ
ncbi:hypothetical protein GPECTOR_17g993 [Gonium pectorale]|uniref:Uncharacterized protein n=1 Tax=Gonium pectorale TaxID=33097 RepID=A0A150GKL9_GONPE|nr:hypothetical protein GPECTOR_17g993 [Gonium pectorale]|eukprot:KXZ50352.1 hypothetical protein GPECTOR_17g993 [Gonium pectorale]